MIEALLAALLPIVTHEAFALLDPAEQEKRMRETITAEMARWPAVPALAPRADEVEAEAHARIARLVGVSDTEPPPAP